MFFYVVVFTLYLKTVKIVANKGFADCFGSLIMLGVIEPPCGMKSLRFLNQMQSVYKLLIHHVG
jgi:hypothetical protein